MTSGGRFNYHGSKGGSQHIRINPVYGRGRCFQDILVPQRNVQRAKLCTVTCVVPGASGNMSAGNGAFRRCWKLSEKNVFPTGKILANDSEKNVGTRVVELTSCDAERHGG